MKKQLVEFIKSNGRTLKVDMNNYRHFITFQEHSKNIMYIYMSKVYIGRTRSQEEREQVTLEFNGKFEFAGMFNMNDEEIYFASYDFEKLLGDDYNDNNDYSNVKQEVAGLIEQRVAELINNDAKSLEKYNDKSEYYGHEEKMQSLFEDRRVADARRLFLNGEKPEDITYKCSLGDNAISSESVLKYFTQGENFINEYAVNHIESKYKQIKYAIAYYQVLKEDLQALYEDKSNSVYTIKALQEAMATGDYKTVNVTVNKDGKELTFKTEARSIGIDRSYYSSYDILAKDREEFYKTFGKHADYNAMEITKITYGRKTLYTK